MQQYKSFGAALVVASALFAISAPAHAQATRTWVSGVGNDVDPCSRTAPCKTFAAAIANTAVNGIINCIDSGAFGTVTIVKSVTIDCHDVFASILNAKEGVNGIIINIPVNAEKDPLRTVRLRNLDISGVSIGNAGVSILAAASVIMEDMSITGQVKDGISDKRTEGNSMLAIKNAIIANNGGVGIAAGAQASTITLDNVHSLKNSYGIALAKNNTATITRSVFSNNTTAGVEADSGGQMMLDNSVVGHNLTGIAANGGPVALANSNVAFNATGITGATTTFGNNRIYGNTVPGVAPSPAGAAASALGQQ